MPSRSYAFGPGEPPRLQLSWTGGFKDLSVSLDHKLIWSASGTRELKQGVSVALPDGSSVFLKLGSSIFLFPQLELTRDGRPLPGSPGDPKTQIGEASGILFFIGIITILLGLVAVATKLDLLLKMGASGWSIAGGAIYLVLGWLVKEKRSLIALGIGTLLFVADGFAMIGNMVRIGGPPPVGAIIVRVMLLVGLIRGFRALLQIQNAPPPPPPPRRLPVRPTTVVPASAPVPQGLPGFIAGSTPAEARLPVRGERPLEKIPKTRVVVADVGRDAVLEKVADIDAQKWALFYPRTVRRKGVTFRELVESIRRGEYDVVHLVALCDEKGRFREAGFVLSLKDLVEACAEAKVKLLWLALDTRRDQVDSELVTAGGFRMHTVITDTRGRGFPAFLSLLLSRTSTGTPFRDAWNQVLKGSAEGIMPVCRLIDGRSDLQFMP